MSKQLNVNLVFNADTSQARAQMQSLQSSINSIATSMASGAGMTGFTSEIGKAQNAVMSLKSNLQQAFNVNTGKLDLVKFNNNLQKSGMQLKDYRVALQQLGPEGQRSFYQLSQAIIQGQMPIKQTTGLLASMMKTFGTSIKYSIAYGAINKIVQGIRDAVSYSRELNAALTDIGVVTGMNVKYMEQFAEKANKAAKELATSTVEFTKASLIYFQQGLSEEDALARAAVTVKLANVTGESAQSVSDQLTAIWNNFYDGSKSLEYYADAITALGAATASSSDEIAQGLEKFAAVADTVGLSYEYATSALATVVAQTRQSADVVGTAFKTLFARIQDLSLGETLDDGTTLGQYSENLAKVGINIKDASGSLKGMDTILNEMGETWQRLDKDQQVALAKGVAGIRQYTQLIALMDNWDTMQMNVQIASTSEGTLEEQQKRWAESWEAANNRVKASAEGLYKNLIDDKFFINLNNLFADLLDTLDEFLEAIGGLKTLLPLIGALMLKTFGPTMATSFANLTANLMGPTQAQRAQAGALQQDAIRQSTVMSSDADSQVGYQYGNNMQANQKMYNAMASVSRKLTQAEMENLQALIQENQAWQEMVIKSAEVLENIYKMNNALQENAGNHARNAEAIKADFLNEVGAVGSENRVGMETVMNQADADMAAAQKGQFALDNFAQSGNLESFEKMNEVLRHGGESIGQTAKEVFGDELWNEFQNMAKNAEKGIEPTTEQLNNFKESLGEVDVYNKQFEKSNDKVTKAVDEFAGGMKDSHKTAQGYMDTIGKAHPKLQATAGAEEAMANGAKKVAEGADAASAAMLKMNNVPLGQQITQMASGIGSLAAGMSMGISGIKSFVTMVQEGEFTLGGFLGALTSLGFALPMILNGLRTLATTQGIVNAVTGTSIGLRWAETAALKAQNNAELVSQALTKAGISQETIKIILGKISHDTSLKQAILNTAEAGTEEKLTEATWKHVAALMAEKVAMGPVMWIIMAIMVAVAAVTAGFIALFKVLQAGTPEAKLKAANEQLDSMKKNLEETKNKYNELNDAISNYKDAQTAISNLTEGTQAWKDSVFELNSQILELIQKYPTLKKFLESDNGVLSINKKGFEQLQQETADTITTQQNNVISQSRYVENLKRNNEWEKFIENRTTGSSDSDLKFVTEDGAEFQTGYSANSTKDFMNAIKDAYLQYGDQIYDKNFSLDTFFEERYKEEGKTGYNYYKDLWSKDPIREDSEFQEYIRGFQEQIISDRKYYDMMAQNSLINHKSDYKGAVVSQYSDAFQTAVETEKLKTDSGEEITRQQFMDNYFKNFLTETSGTDYHASVRGKFKNEYIDGIQSKEDMAKWLVSQATGATMSEIEAGDYQIKGIGGDTIKYKAKDSDEWTKVDYETYSQQLWEQYIKQETDKKVEKMDADAQAVAAELQKGGLKSAKDSGALAKAVESWYDSNNETLDLSDFTRAEIKNVDTSKFEDENIKNAFDKGVQEYEQKLTEANLKATDDWFKNREQREAEELDSLLKASEMTTEDFEDLTETIAKTRNVSADVAKSMAKDLLKTSQATKKLGEIYEDNNDVLKKGSKDAIKGSKQLSAAYITARNDIKDTIKEMTDVDLDDAKIDELIDDGTIEEAANNSEEAIKKIKLAAADQVLLDMDIDTSTEDGQDIFDKLQSQIEAVKNTDISLTPNIDIKDAIKELNALISSGQITAEQANKYLKSIGFSPVVETTKKKVTNHIDIWRHNIITGEKEHIAQDEVSTIDVPEIRDAKYEGFNTTTLPNSGGSKKSGGGGGSSSKKEKKTASNEIERYHEISKTLDDVSRSLDDIATAKDRAFGPNKLKLLDDEIAKNKELLDVQKQYLSEINTNLASDKAAILKYGVEFDENGNISNYDEVFQAQIDKFNKSKRGDKDEKAYEEFKEFIEQYEETLELSKDKLQEIKELEYTIKDQALEKIETELEFKITISDYELEIIDYLLSKIEDDAFKAAEAIGLLSQQAGETEKKLRDTINATQEVIKTVEDNQVLEQGDVDLLTEYSGDMISLLQDLEDVRESIGETLPEAMDAWNEKLEENINKLDHYTGLLDNMQNIIDLIGRENLLNAEGKALGKDVIKNLYQGQIDIGKANIVFYKNQLEANQKLLTTYRKNLADAQQAQNEEDAKYWEEQIKTVEEAMQESESGLYDSLSTTLDSIVNAFSANINSIADTFSEAVAGISRNIEAMQELFDKQTEINERYLSDYEKTYEISKLTRQISDSIDKTDNLSSKRELLELQKNIQGLAADGVELTETELNYQQQKYELMLAEQAFRDAQNAKNTVRLQRDSEGNYGYVYTADQAATDQAEQNFEDKLFAMQQSQDEAMQNVSENIMGVLSDADSKIREIADSASLTKEQKEAQINAIIEDTNNSIDYWRKQGEQILENNKELNTKYGTEMATEFSGTILGSLYPEVENFGELGTLISTNLTTAGKELMTSVSQYHDWVNGLTEVTGSTLNEMIVSGIDSIASDTKSIANKLAEENGPFDQMVADIEDIAQEVVDNFGTLNTTIDTLSVTVTDILATIRRLMADPTFSSSVTIKDVVKDASGTEYYKADNNKYYEHSELKDSQGKALGSDMTGEVLKGTEVQVAANAGTTSIVTLEEKKEQDLLTELSKYSIFEIAHNGKGKTLDKEFYSEDESSYKYTPPTKNYGNVMFKGEIKKFGNTWYALMEDSGKIDCGFANKAALAWIPIEYLSTGDSKNNKNKLKKIDSNLYTGFDTGGYTGAWGPEGRLAMLHQKELILNAHDTENFLTAIGIVRDISNRLEQTAAAMRYDNQLAQFHNTIKTSDGTLQQEVTIHAEFPNATDHNEIEEAFRNLTNLASQYANRKS